jgi:glycosyltransferase involved in cell wall biosynthesis
VSEAMASKVAALPGIDPGRVVTVANGYDAGVFGVGPAPRSGGLLFVGALRDVKNPLTLVEAYAAVADEIGVPLSLIGEGPLRVEIETLIADKGLGDAVRLEGFRGRHDVADALMRATAFVLPSAREGMPISVIEALACGTPVVASRVGGIPELVNAANGILVEPGDVRSLSAALVEARGREWEPNAVRAASPVRSWDEVAAQLLEVYAEVISETGGRP